LAECVEMAFEQLNSLVCHCFSPLSLAFTHQSEIKTTQFTFSPLEAFGMYSGSPKQFNGTVAPQIFPPLIPICHRNQ
ncbi:MAG: hypothetical protein LBU46_05620, partial [Candidatus Accumulibacter sp.]|nr:hypothetical protein [Accumulibacter sp.]